MRFGAPLLRGRLVRRYKRFLADIDLESGERITAHTPNTGSMLTCCEPGALSYVSRADSPARKLAYTWELVASGDALVGIHTHRANALAREAIESGVIAELADYGHIRREVRYGQGSRVDLLLTGEDRPPCYVEVKNVTLGRGGVASFPDAVSARGTKHLGDLAAEVARGHAAAMLYVVQREDCTVFTPADDIDPLYGRTLREVAAAGVQVLAYRARVTPEAIDLVDPLPVEL